MNTAGAPEQVDGSEYLVFVDESGDHSLSSINQEWPLFVLSFCVVSKAEYCHQITPAVRQLKIELFGHDLVVFHERDIVKRKGAFAAMDEKTRIYCLERLSDIIGKSSLTLIAVVIDKAKHKEKYFNPIHPYHLAMQFGLERCHHFLSMQGQGEHTTWIICEARGPAEDKELELQFLRVCAGDNRSRKRLPFSIWIADKKTNSEGLQIADLTARPAGLSVLRPDQPNKAWDVLKGKLFAGRYNCVMGNGLKVFP